MLQLKRNEKKWLFITKKTLITNFPFSLYKLKRWGQFSTFVLNLRLKTKMQWIKCHTIYSKYVPLLITFPNFSTFAVAINWIEFFYKKKLKKKNEKQKMVFNNFMIASLFIKFYKWRRQINDISVQVIDFNQNA